MWVLRSLVVTFAIPPSRQPIQLPRKSLVPSSVNMEGNLAFAYL